MGFSRRQVFTFDGFAGRRLHFCARCVEDRQHHHRHLCSMNGHHLQAVAVSVIVSTVASCTPPYGGLEITASRQGNPVNIRHGKKGFSRASPPLQAVSRCSRGDTIKKGVCGQFVGVRSGFVPCFAHASRSRRSFVRPLFNRVQQVQRVSSFFNMAEVPRVCASAAGWNLPPFPKNPPHIKKVPRAVVL